MKKMDFCEAMGEIQADYIQAAHAPQKTGRIKWGTMAACFCLCAIVGISTWQRGISNHGGQPGQTEDAAQTGKNNLQEDNGALDPLKPATAYHLLINEIPSRDLESLFSSASWFNLNEKDFQEMTRDEVLDYFCVELNLDDARLDYHAKDGERYGFYHFLDGSVFDQQRFGYANDAGAEIYITLRKGGLPAYSVSGEQLYNLEITQIGDCNVVAIHYIDFDGQSVYYAEFMKAGNGYTVFANGASLDDFHDVLTTLLQ